MGTNYQADIINYLAGIAADSELARLRAERPETLQFAQGSYSALLEPDDPGGVSKLERAAIALRVATLERCLDVAEFYRERVRTLDMSDEMIAAIEVGSDGAGLAARLSAILGHADLLTTSSRTGSPAAIESLREAGLTVTDIVTVSQLIAYLSYQIRMIATLRAMGGAA
jgi:CMD domain protein